MTGQSKEKSKEKSKEATKTPVVHRSRRGRFLIVDDEPSIGKVLVRMLGDEHEAVTVASGAKAKELLADDHQFDGIICDLMMPEVTGMDLHAWVEREHPELARNMIFATGGAFTPRSREFLNRVRNPRINKPIDRKNLLGWLRKMVEPEHSSSMRDGA